MRLLCTGAAGFISSNVIDALVGQGHIVTGVDMLDEKIHPTIPNYLNPKVEYIYTPLHIWNPPTLDFEAVIHFAALGGVSRAAREPKAILVANCLGTERLCQIIKDRCPKLKQAILASSFSIYGNNYKYFCTLCPTIPDHSSSGTRTEEDLTLGNYEVLCPQCNGPMVLEPITEKTLPSPLELYAVSKYTQELLWNTLFCKKTTLRFSSVYGPRLRLHDGEATIIAKLAGWIKDGIPPTLFEDGKQLRDWIYVGDVIHAINALLEGREAAPIINVCSGAGTTLLDACNILAETFHTTCYPKIVGGYRSGDIRHCIGDYSNFKKLTGKIPIPFSIESALASFIK